MTMDDKVITPHKQQTYSDPTHSELEEVLDWLSFIDRVDGDMELALELVEIFLAGLPQQWKQIVDNVVSADALAVRKSAHTIKGAVSNFGAHEAVTAALALEKMARNGDLTSAPEALAHLEIEIGRVRTVLTAWRDNNSSNV
ncbi:MAG: Hpt domain-containing protein [Deltaproteobacteria bacterium]|nr:Hpt domain-containing protein [Deltaproteobacteria bacterium]